MHTYLAATTATSSQLRDEGQGGALDSSSAAHISARISLALVDALQLAALP